jgi:hypothetical protein
LEEKTQGLNLIFIQIKFHFGIFRDFAYVAKDKDRIYKCHVFRCDNTSARIIANTLRDICRNIMIKRGLLSTTMEYPNDGIVIEKR